MTENKETAKPVTGRTWADLMAGLPIWILAVAATAFITLMVHAMFFATDQRQMGILGTWGVDSVVSADGFPSGAVVAFDNDLKTSAGCPEGWSFFEPAGGRMIVGAGDHDNQWFAEGSNVAQRLTIYQTYAQDARAGIQDSEEARATGGTPTVALTVSQMPPHQHATTPPVAADDQGLWWTPWGQSGDTPHDFGYQRALFSASFRTNEPGGYPNTSIAGGQGDVAAPHNNMPPFIALYYCKKD